MDTTWNVRKYRKSRTLADQSTWVVSLENWKKHQNIYLQLGFEASSCKTSQFFLSQTNRPDSDCGGIVQKHGMLPVGLKQLSVWKINLPGHDFRSLEVDLFFIQKKGGIHGTIFFLPIQFMGWFLYGTVMVRRVFSMTFITSICHGIDFSGGLDDTADDAQGPSWNLAELVASSWSLIEVVRVGEFFTAVAQTVWGWGGMFVGILLRPICKD